MKRRRPFSPPRLLALGMGGLILVGSLLLATPLASATGDSVGARVAFVTATSAVCVTGLIVVDTPAAFSWFGEAVLLLLIQVGGLGYMMLSTLVAVALGRRVSIQERRSLQESLSLASRRDLLQFAGAVIRLTLAFEAAGALILTLRWWGEYGLGGAAWLGVFHAVSAFNNAGFSLFPTSLMAWRGDVTVNATIMALIIAGGIGYVVLLELRSRRRVQPLSLHTRFVLILTGMLISVPALAFFLIERSNAATLGALPWWEGALAAVFQSVTTRTAGFNTLDIAALEPASHFLMLALMFIGGAPGGTAGGVKLSTFGVIVLALWATVRGMREPAVLWRRLPADLVARAFFIALIAFLALNTVAAALLVMERGAFLPTLFEATSAFGTVGLSTGVAGRVTSLVGEFSTAGQLLVCALMFMGRLGPLTLAFALAGAQPPSRLSYPEGRVLLG